MPRVWPTPAPEEIIAPLAAILDTQQDEIEALKVAVSAAGDTSGLSSEIATLQRALIEATAAISTESNDQRLRLESALVLMDQLEERLIEVEKRPISESAASDGAVAAYERELSAMRETLQQQRRQIESIAAAAGQIATAERGANAAAARAALGRIQAALDSGGGYTAALADFRAASDVEIPDVLGANARTGVPTQATLLRAFPKAARAALDAATRAGVEDGSVSRLGAFVRNQLGARSLSARDGGDADAVLSRAEAALSRGALEPALDELSNLAEAGQAAMAGWISDAQDRQQALTAAETLTVTISRN
ncbi:MAG: COG4223 family protein [Halocynthiibacter sp.]